MKKKWFFRVLIITVVLLIPIISGIPLNGYAGAPEPPKEGEIITGPQIVGTLTLIHSGDPDDFTVKAIFYGFCRGVPYPLKQKFCTWPIFVRFNEMRAKNLKNYRIYDAGPIDCRSECGGEDLYIVQVNKFERKSATKIVADVVIKYIVEEGE
jgi:hypothetical protein